MIHSNGSIIKSGDNFPSVRREWNRAYIQIAPVECWTLTWLCLRAQMHDADVSIVVGSPDELHSISREREEIPISPLNKEEMRSRSIQREMTSMNNIFPKSKEGRQQDSYGGLLSTQPILQTVYQLIIVSVCNRMVGKESRGVSDADCDSWVR